MNGIPRAGVARLLLDEIIDPATALGQLVHQVENANLGILKKQPLLATLRAAMSAFDRGEVTAALNQLFAFQNKVRAQVAPRDEALATQLTAASQQIIDAVSGH